MVSAKMLAACLLLASVNYHLPWDTMTGIALVEGGGVATETGPNADGSFDLGPMQVNSIWVPKLARIWNVDEKTAHGWLRDNVCVNVYVSAWILRQKLEEIGNLYDAIAVYNAGTLWRGYSYADKVVAESKTLGLPLLATPTTPAQPAVIPPQQPVVQGFPPVPVLPKPNLQP